MSQIGVVAKLVARPGQRDQLAAALQPLVDAARDEPGTIYYLLHSDSAEAEALWFYELYTDQAALDAHQASDTYRGIGPAIGSLLAGAPELHFSTLVGGKGA